MKKILIISDGKAGHLNQSIAFCKLKAIPYDVREVHFHSSVHRIFSYIFDRFKIYLDSLFQSLGKYHDDENYCAVVSAGSATYYYNKLFSKRASLPSIALMYPKGYVASTFDYIIAQSHDTFRSAENIIEVPLNLSFISPNNHIDKTLGKKSLAIIIGGSNDVFSMAVGLIDEQLNEIFNEYPKYLKYITTSRRTAPEIERLLDDYIFDYRVDYSKTPTINPIDDFIKLCDKFFITIDSTSMISEVRANSDATIEIIDLPSSKKNTKYHRLASIVENNDRKVDFKPYLDRIPL